jgi:hypothetical protein
MQQRIAWPEKKSILVCQMKTVEESVTVIFVVPDLIVTDQPTGRLSDCTESLSIV